MGKIGKIFLDADFTDLETKKLKCKTQNQNSIRLRRIKVKNYRQILDKITGLIRIFTAESAKLAEIKKGKHEDFRRDCFPPRRKVAKKF